MTDLPHVIAAGAATEEHIRVVEAYCREYDLPLPGINPRADEVNAAVDWWNALGAEMDDTLPPGATVYETPHGDVMWGTWEAGDAERPPDRLAAVMAYCAAHPYDGPEVEAEPIYFEQHYDHDTDMRTVWSHRPPPKFTDIAAFFLEDDDSLVRFEDDAVVFPVQPRTLRYRPLYARLTSRTIVLQRIDEEEA